MAGIVGWAVILGAAFAWEGLALRAPDDQWLTLSDILRYVTRPALGRWVLFALWLWIGWHLFVRGWDFFLQDPGPRGGTDDRRPGGGDGLREAFVPLLCVYGVLLGLLGYCARGAARANAQPDPRGGAARGGGWPALLRHVAVTAAAGYALFLVGLALFDAAWGRDPTLVADALAGGAGLAAIAATALVALAAAGARRRA